MIWPNFNEIKGRAFVRDNELLYETWEPPFEPPYDHPAAAFPGESGEPARSDAEVPHDERELGAVRLHWAEIEETSVKQAFEYLRQLLREGRRESI